MQGLVSPYSKPWAHPVDECCLLWVGVLLNYYQIPASSQPVMVHVRTQTPNEPSLGAGVHAPLGLALTPIKSRQLDLASLYLKSHDVVTGYNPTT
jgi:hypothetical protein